MRYIDRCTSFKEEVPVPIFPKMEYVKEDFPFWKLIFLPFKNFFWVLKKIVNIDGMEMENMKTEKHLQSDTKYFTKDSHLNAIKKFIIRNSRSRLIQNIYFDFFEEKYSLSTSNYIESFKYQKKKHKPFYEIVKSFIELKTINSSDTRFTVDFYTNFPSFLKKKVLEKEYKEGEIVTVFISHDDYCEYLIDSIDLDIFSETELIERAKNQIQKVENRLKELEENND